MAEMRSGCASHLTFDVALDCRTFARFLRRTRRNGMPNDTRRTILRNMLLGKWAAEKLGLKGPEADDYTAALAGVTGHHEHGDVFSKLRRDFDAASVAQSDQQILDAMHELMLK